MAKIFWDTNLFIYLMEENPRFSPPVLDLRKRMLARGDHLFTSALTVGEILVKPAELGRDDLVSQYRRFFEHPSISVVPFDARAAYLYARIRRDRTISRPDAIQLACAASVDTDLFLTNDARLSRKTVDGIKFVTSLEAAPL